MKKLLTYIFFTCCLIIFVISGIEVASLASTHSQDLVKMACLYLILCCSLYFAMKSVDIVDFFENHIKNALIQIKEKL